MKRTAFLAALALAAGCQTDANDGTEIGRRTVSTAALSTFDSCDALNGKAAPDPERKDARAPATERGELRPLWRHGVMASDGSGRAQGR